MASRTDQFKAAKQEMQRAFEKAEEEEKRQTKETDEAKEPSPWLRRVGCIPHLAGVDRKEVRELVEPVDDEEEPHLAFMCTAFEWLVEDAQYKAVRDVVGIHTLFEANKKVEKETNMPFDSWMDMTTIERYVEVWKQLLLFVFRAEDDEPEFRPPYVLTEAQQSAMQTVRDKIGAFQEWKEEQEGGGGGGDGDEDEGFDDGEDDGGPDEEVHEEVDEGFEDEMSEETKWMRQIQREVLRFFIALLDHPLQDDEYQSAIISGLAVLMIKGDKGWHDASPQSFTFQNPTSSEEGQSIPRSRCSSVSFDKGFAADRDPVGESRAFEAQNHQRSRQRWRIEADSQREGHEVWNLETRLDSWVGKCPLCYTRRCQGLDVDVRHTLENCPDESRTKVITEIEALKTIRFEPYASCTFCTVAQKVCTRWAETREGSNRFRKVEGGVCQYNGIVRAAVAAMSIAAPVEVAREGLYGQMKALGIWGRGEGEWSEEDHTEVRRVMLIWFGKKIIWGGMEASVLLRVFYWLTVGLEDGVESIE
ncbi:hypothetical protein V502_03128 [Pseudogymnoascus sp. VKM F-4520 (FW-2644)]|nr:hypothetical protein V502_03128 [Pseudogymnoascus sp. VKM F-4520 (FW-2644)]